MPDIQTINCTIRSHGAQVVKVHLRDWLILLLLVVIDAGLNMIEPFHRFVGKGMMEDLMFPFKENTVPVWAVPVVAVLLPFFVILGRYFIRNDVYDFHHATLGLLFSVLITGVITDAIKDAVGRPRPNFFWRCFPDGKPIFDQVYGGVICNGQKKIIKEGYKSFPSGHTSWTFSGLVFLSLYIAGKVSAFDQRGHIAKLCIVFSPILMACLMGVSRVDDYWHHWTDVFAGALIGSVVASFCYLQFFPPPYDTFGWGPRAYFEMLEESTRNFDGQQPPEFGIGPHSMSANSQALDLEMATFTNDNISESGPILDGAQGVRR